MPIYKISNIAPRFYFLGEFLPNRWFRLTLVVPTTNQLAGRVVFSEVFLKSICHEYNELHTFERHLLDLDIELRSLDEHKKKNLSALRQEKSRQLEKSKDKAKVIQEFTAREIQLFAAFEAKRREGQHRHEQLKEHIKKIKTFQFLKNQLFRIHIGGNQ